MESLNINNRGIELKYKAHQHSIHFLDLKIWAEEDQLLTSTYFKPTFIARDSCHHKSWLDSVPKSQYLHLRRDCSRLKDFETAAAVLTDRLANKGYSVEILDQTVLNAWMSDRDVLLFEKTKNDSGENNFTMPFITSYYLQHYQIKSFVCKHWHILKNDSVLDKSLSNQPQVVFRGVPLLRDIIAPGVCDPPNIKPMFFLSRYSRHSRIL